MAIWLGLDIYYWNCHFKKSEIAENEYCSTTENWVGSIYGFLIMLSFLLFTKGCATIIFVIALLRINSLLAKLKQFGYVNSVCALRFHLIHMLIALISAVVLTVLALFMVASAI